MAHMLEQSDYDLMKFKPSEQVRKYLRVAYSCTSEADIPDKITEAAKNDFKEAIELYEFLWLRPRLPKNIFIHKLIEGCEIVLPEVKIPPRNPELERRIQKLKAMEEERKYREMTKNVDSLRARHPEDSIAYQLKEMNRQLIGVLQVLISVATGFVFGFIGLNWAIGPLEPGFRLLLGLFCAAIIGVAELYFFIKKLNDPILEDYSKKSV